MLAYGDGPRRTVLPNGLRVVTVARSESPLAAVKLFVKVGSRHDGPFPGVAHMVEHLLLANTGSRAARVAHEAVESLGGELNAVTTREYTGLQAVVLAPHLDRVAHLIADLLEPAALDPAAFDRERSVIRQEILRHRGSPQAIWDRLLAELWGRHPLVHPVLGTPDSVDALTLAAVAGHASRYRAASRLVLAAAGAVDHEALVQTAALRFGDVPPGASVDPEPAGADGRGGTLVQQAGAQIQLVIGLDGVGMRDPRRSHLRLLEIVLGRGASSRLHRALRTDRGYVYAVSAVAMSYADRGYFAVCTACAPEHIRAVRGIVTDELDRLGRQGVTEAELARAKFVYAGALARDFETVLSVASILGIEELLDRIESFGDGVARINAVGLADLQRVAAEMLNPERMAIVPPAREREVGWDAGVRP